MQRQRRIAVGTPQDISTIAAKDIRCSPTPVEEEDGLLAALQCGLKLLEQEPAEDPALTRFEFLPHIHDVDGRHFRLDNTPWQIQFTNRPHPLSEKERGVCLISLFNSRRGRPQHTNRTTQSRIHLRRVHRMIERRLGLIKGRVATFIRNDETDIRQRYEQRASCADDHFEFSRTRAAPGIVARPLRKFRMNQPYLPGEATQKATDDLRRERYLMHKNDRLPAALDDMFCCAQIDFCFARTRHTLKQEWGASVG